MTTVNANSTRYAQDSNGQWWYTFGDGRRTRARLETCESCSSQFPTFRSKQQFCSTWCRGVARAAPQVVQKCIQCGTEFEPTVKSQRFCSHGCAATHMHARRDVTTPDGRVVKNTTDHHYTRDERGQWWYTPGSPGGAKRYSRTRAYIKTCDTCGEPFLTNIFHRKRQGTCSKQCGQIAFNKQNPGIRAGKNSGRWKGGRRTEADGYVIVLAPDHHSLKGSLRRYVFEHRLVMEAKINRPLLPNEQVHHINGIRNDNRQENLELWALSHPSGQRAHERQHCATCTCFVVTEDG